MKSLLICGGVGGAKLAYGFYNSIPHDAFDILVNTGDDFIHLGLHVSPDLDTVIYTLSEEVEVSQGWGRQNESWNMLNELKHYVYISKLLLIHQEQPAQIEDLCLSG